MKELKRFNAKSYLRHLKKTVKEMNQEDAYLMCKGVYLLWDNLEDYYKDKYGSPKRLDDLFEYIRVIQIAYLSKFKEEKELPY